MEGSSLPAAPPPSDAVERVHADLAHLRRQRAIAFIAVTVVLGATFFAFALLRRDAHLAATTEWTIAIALFFTAAVCAASLTLGFPLWQRVGTFVMTFGGSVAAVVGVGLLVDGRAQFVGVAPSLPCFGTGTAVGAIVFAVTVALTGRLWRKMADPTWIAAVGASSVGLALLNAHCPHQDAVHLFGFHLPLVVVVYLLAGRVLALREHAH